MSYTMKISHDVKVIFILVTLHGSEIVVSPHKSQLLICQP